MFSSKMRQMAIQRAGMTVNKRAFSTNTAPTSDDSWAGVGMGLGIGIVIGLIEFTAIDAWSKKQRKEQEAESMQKQMQADLKEIRADLKEINAQLKASNRLK